MVVRGYSNNFTQAIVDDAAQKENMGVKNKVIDG